jgi:hypothetical protein
MKKMHSGGGRTHVEVKQRLGARAEGIRPGAVSQIGTAIDPKARTPMKGPMPAGGGVPLGNAIATNVGKGGPGAGRTVMPCGTQGMHGPVAGQVRPQGRDILSEYGPEISGRKRG